MLFKYLDKYSYALAHGKKILGERVGRLNTWQFNTRWFTKISENTVCSTRRLKFGLKTSYFILSL